MVTFCVALPAVGAAIGPLPHTFEAGEPVRAADFNANFDHLQSGIEQVEQRLVISGATLRSAFGRYCGATSPTAGRVSTDSGGESLTGVRAAKTLCEASCGTPTAHVCTVAELIASVDVGDEPPNGWCRGEFQACASLEGAFTNNVARGYEWGSQIQSAFVSDCDATLPVLCCD